MILSTELLFRSRPKKIQIPRIRYRRESSLTDEPLVPSLALLRSAVEGLVVTGEDGGQKVEVTRGREIALVDPGREQRE